MAPSRQADFLRALYQDWTDRMVADPNLSIANLRSMFDEWGQRRWNQRMFATGVITSGVSRPSGRSLLVRITPAQSSIPMEAALQSALPTATGNSRDI
jgi:hypothetical protein